MNDRLRTPLEKLIFEKEQVRLECMKKEDEMTDGLSYVQDHAGSMLLSGVSSLIFPKTKTSAKKSLLPHKDKGKDSGKHGISDYLAMAKDMLPTALEIATPFLFTWGLKNVPKWLFRLVRRK